MKLWIDDMRPAPEGYIWCKSTLNALHTIYHNADDIEEIALDHDAGEYATEGGDFIKVLEELERLCHSKNALNRAYWLEHCIRYRFSFHRWISFGGVWGRLYPLRHGFGVESFAKGKIFEKYASIIPRGRGFCNTALLFYTRGQECLQSIHKF